MPGYKLVAKRSTRQWVDEGKAAKAIYEMSEAGVVEYAEFFTEPEIKSPAQTEKLLKKAGLELPKELVVSISSGNTMASEDDPRPAVVLIGQQLTAALNKLQ